MRSSPSIIPDDADRDIYLVLDDFGRLGRAWRETDESAAADRDALIRDLLVGQYRNPVRSISDVPMRAPCRNRCSSFWSSMGSNGRQPPAEDHPGEMRARTARRHYNASARQDGRSRCPGTSSEPATAAMTG